MIEATNFAGQNWLITPTPAPNNQKKFLLVLSGVVIIDLKGVSEQNWRREQISIRPDMVNPIKHAITQNGVTTPPGTLGSTYFAGLDVDQWVPFAAPSSMFNRNVAHNSGHAVDTWRPNPFGNGTDLVTNQPYARFFSGINVDVAVRDTDAFLHRLSYHVTLLGKIVFGPIIIT